MNIFALLFINKPIILRQSSGYFKLCEINQDEIKYINEFCLYVADSIVVSKLTTHLSDLRFIRGLSKYQLIFNFTRVVS